MGWAEIRIQQYNLGEEASWVVKRNLENANPVNKTFHILGAIPIIYGLWIHSWVLIFVGILLTSLAMHIVG